MSAQPHTETDQSPKSPHAAAGKKQRLDVALVERGLEHSRERAQRLIVAGEVTVGGRVAKAPSTLVSPAATIVVGKTLPFVGRGGFKLAHALDRFAIDVAGLLCLDAGASTGGFTDVLLQRGAARVYAADVGKGLLAWSLRQDPRVVVMEGVNVRYLRLALQDQVASQDHVASHQHRAFDSGQTAETGAALPQPVQLAAVDVAFISLRLVLPAIKGVLAGAGEMVALVKPQFEAGRRDVGKGGVVRDSAVHRRVLREVCRAARDVGLHPAGLTASPIRGQAGNVEFLLWARRNMAGPFDEDAQIERALAEAPN